MDISLSVSRTSPSFYSIAGLVFQEGLKIIVETATAEAGQILARHPLIGMSAIGGIYNFRQRNYFLGSALSLMPSFLLTVHIGSIVSSFLGLKSDAGENRVHPVSASGTERICPFEIEEFKKCPVLEEEVKQLALICEAPSRAYNQSREFRLLKNKGLYSNLQSAKEILKDTLDTVRFSPNYMARSWKIIEERAKTQGVLLKDLPELDISCLLGPIFRCFQIDSFLPESPRLDSDSF